jgi:hypothetical protein
MNGRTELKLILKTDFARPWANLSTSREGPVVESNECSNEH